MRFAVPTGASRLIVSKGSVALDGVSLTVAARSRGSFAVSVIPETLRRTTLGRLEENDAVNFEADVFARYGHGAQRRVRGRGTRLRPPRGGRG